MISETRVVETDRCNAFSKHPRKCLSWSAIIAGAIVGFGISFLLNLFGVAIGLSAFTNTAEGVQAFAIGGFIGMIIISIVSMFVAGTVAGHLGRAYSMRRNIGALYGFLTFGVALFIAAALTVPMTRFVTNYSNGLHPASAVVVANPTGNSSTVVTSRGATTHAAALNSNNSAAAASTEQRVNDLGNVALLTFFLFAIGAFSACIGGHCGMKCRCDDDCVVDEKVVTRKDI